MDLGNNRQQGQQMIFIYVDRDSDVQIRYCFNSDGEILPNVLEHFKNFLCSIGYAVKYSDQIELIGEEDTYVERVEKTEEAS